MSTPAPAPKPPSFVPRLHTDTGTERRATSLELFFDLVFVVAIAQLSSTLHHHLTGAGVAGFAALFVPVWWQWIDFSYYADQFDNDDLPMRVVLLTAMLGTLAMAAAIPNALHGGEHTWAATMVALRLLMTGLYVWAWRNVAAARELAGRYALSFSVALCAWAASLFAAPPACFALWAVALCIEISNGPIAYATVKNVPQQVSHMDERFGLFTLIVLGETVASVVTGVSGTRWAAGSGLCAAAAFGATCCFWWLYFGHASTSVIHDALRGSRLALLLSYVYGYGHLPIFMGTVAAGVGMEACMEAAAHGQTLSFAGRLCLCGGTALFLASLTVTQWGARGSLPLYKWAARGAGIGACVLLLLWGGTWPPAVLAGACAAACGGIVAWQARRRAQAESPAHSAAENGMV